MYVNAPAGYPDGVISFDLKKLKLKIVSMYSEGLSTVVYKHNIDSLNTNT